MRISNESFFSLKNHSLLDLASLLGRRTEQGVAQSEEPATIMYGVLFAAITVNKLVELWDESIGAAPPESCDARVELSRHILDGLFSILRTKIYKNY